MSQRLGIISILLVSGGICGLLFLAQSNKYFSQTGQSVTPTPTPGLSVLGQKQQEVKYDLQGINTPTPIVILGERHPRKPSLPPKPVVNGPSCIPQNYDGKGLTIAGGNVNPPIHYTDISTKSEFQEFYRKDMTGSISISGLGGFLKYPSMNTPLLLQPDTTYYIRFYNGLANTNGFSPVSVFSFPQC